MREMPTLEQIDNGAAYYDSEAAKAHHQSKHHERIDSRWADEWKAKALEHERIAKELRALASG